MAVTRVKICGLTLPQDLEAALEYGADAVGFVFESTSPRYLTEEKAKDLLQRVPPFVFRVGVYGALHGDCPRTLLDACQAVHWGAFAFSQDLFVRKILALRLGRGPGKIDEAKRAAADYDALLLDAYDEKAFGGTGKKVDWGFAAEVVAAVSKPVILAGGLTPENVAEAVAKVGPFAVDVSSGVESEPGIKDPLKIRDFIQAAQGSG
jgi:phosphoribosylanthranilate isomerase